ncbi:hypothetical protein [Bacteroides congonensis]
MSIEVNETPKEVIEVSSLPDVQEISAESCELKEIWNEFATSINEFAESTTLEGEELPREIVEAREYGVDECVDVVKKCFPLEVINEWGHMTLEQRNEVIQEYASGIGEALGIDFKGIVWEKFPIENGRYIGGFNNGDGYIHLNVDILADPAQLMKVIDVVAHEERHQLQNEAIVSPEKFPIDEATIKEWTVAKSVYTTDQPTAYDPWGYSYNPMETDSYFFGGSMVRELTKALINDIV